MGRVVLRENDEGAAERVDNATTTREATATVREDGLVSRLERTTAGRL